MNVLRIFFQALSTIRSCLAPLSRLIPDMYCAHWANKIFIPPCDQEPTVNLKQHFYDCVQWQKRHNNEQLEYDLYSNHLQNPAENRHTE